MRNFTLTSLLLFSSFSALAQFDYEMNHEERLAYESHQQHDAQIRKSWGINTKNIYRISRNDSVLYQVMEFDPEGRLTKFKGYKKNGKERGTRQYTYDEKGRMLTSHDIKNGVIQSGQSWVYNETSAEFIEMAWLKKKGKIRYKTIRKFDEANNLVLAQGYYGKNASKPSWRYEYDYYDNGNKKESRYFNSKGKLKEVYTYDCNQVPKTDKEMMKDTLRTCIKYETDASGNRTKIIEKQDEKGRISVTRLTYDIKNNLIGSKYISKGKTVYNYDWQLNDKDLVVAAVFINKKPFGYKTRTYAHMYDEEGKVIRTAAIENNKPKEYVSSYTKF